MAGGLEVGGPSGWFGAGNEMLGQQASQTQRALEIAKMILTQRQSQHQEMMDQWMKDPNNPLNLHAAAQAKYWEDQAETNKQYRKDQQETAAEKVKNDAIEKLTAEGDKAYNI